MYLSEFLTLSYLTQGPLSTSRDRNSNTARVLRPPHLRILTWCSVLWLPHLCILQHVFPVLLHHVLFYVFF